MVPAVMRLAKSDPVVMRSAVKPSPVPKVRQSQLPSALVPLAMRKPWLQTWMALPPVFVGSPFSSSGTLAQIVPCSKDVKQ